MNQLKSTVTGTRGHCFDRRVKSHLYTRTTEGRQTAESRRASQMFLNASLIALQIPDQVVNREAEQAITPTTPTSSGCFLQGDLWVTDSHMTYRDISFLNKIFKLTSSPRATTKFELICKLKSFVERIPELTVHHCSSFITETLKKKKSVKLKPLNETTSHDCIMWRGLVHHRVKQGEI